MTFDPKCYDLAEHFLPEEASERLKNQLAQEIQSSIEDWLRFEVSQLSGDALHASA